MTFPRNTEETEALRAVKAALTGTTELLAALDHIRALLDGVSDDPESFVSEAYRTAVQALERHKRENV